MSITLHTKKGALLAQELNIRLHHLDTDVSIEEGGEDLGPSPHDLYDAALASCTALTVMWYAKKKKIAVTDLETRIERDDTQERQGKYQLKLHLLIKGSFSEEELAQLRSVADKCPVHKLMSTVSTEITSQVERAL